MALLWERLAALLWRANKGARRQHKGLSRSGAQPQATHEDAHGVKALGERGGLRLQAHFEERGVGKHGGQRLLHGGRERLEAAQRRLGWDGKQTRDGHCLCRLARALTFAAGCSRPVHAAACPP